VYVVENRIAGFNAGSSLGQRWMRRFVRVDFGYMLQRQTDVIETMHQAMSTEWFDGKCRFKATGVKHSAGIQVDR
jgi:hypothetical protein